MLTKTNSSKPTLSWGRTIFLSVAQCTSEMQFLFVLFIRREDLVSTKYCLFFCLIFHICTNFTISKKFSLSWLKTIIVFIDSNSHSQFWRLQPYPIGFALNLYVENRRVWRWIVDYGLWLRLDHCYWAPKPTAKILTKQYLDWSFRSHDSNIPIEGAS